MKIAMVNPDLENRFTYHKPTEKQVLLIEQIRSACKALAYKIEETCPNSRDKSVALTELESVMMRATASIVKN